MQLVLASTSVYRKQLLQKLGLPFETASPDIDESPLDDETPQQLVMRLAEAKAKTIAQQFPDALIIGSDQVAVIGDTILGKPGNFENAVAQLQAAAGKQVDFKTGLCLYNSATRHGKTRCETYSVVFRHLSDEQIKSYVRHEQPYDCAGSFKSEGLGIALFERLMGDDPNTLVGLPLIALIQMLEKEGVGLP
jgi:septum formation protein